MEAPPPESFGPYRILRRLGAGAMGVVYLAQDGEREVALKLLHPQVLERGDAGPRFARELKVSLALRDPYVVASYAGGEYQGRCFIASEVVRGGSLDDLLQAGPLPERRALELIRDLCLGLAAVERAGLVHRDVKPANLLIDAAGRGKLADLGLVRSVDPDRTRYTQTGTIVGTPAYMSPEQVDGSTDLGIRTDLYAAGASLFKCLTGVTPYRGTTILEILRGHLDAPIPDPNQVLPGCCAPATAALIRALLAKEPGQRPASPGEVVARLEALLAGLGGGGSRPDPGVFPGTLPDAPAAPAAFPRTLPDAPAAPAAFPHTLPDAPADPAAARVLAPETDSAAGLARAQLCDGEGRTLFLYVGTRLRLGRDGFERGHNDVCLRPRPAAQHADAIRRVSSRHFELELTDEGARVSDPGSTLGTFLSGARVPVGVSTPLPPLAELRVADALDLRLRTLDNRAAEPLELAGAGRIGARPSLVVERPHNGQEHAYALIPDRLGLGLAPDGALRALPAVGAELELLVARGALWARARGSGACRPLVAGATLQLGARTLRVASIQPEDQK